jgi:hypothetical protein
MVGAPVTLPADHGGLVKLVDTRADLGVNQRQNDNEGEQEMNGYERFAASMKRAALLVLGASGLSGVSVAMTVNTPPDGNGHPAVVALLSSDGTWAYPFCSGMLLSSKVVLTASHCLAVAQQLQQDGWQLSATNDPALARDANGWLAISSLTTNSEFDQIVLNPAYDPKVLGGYDHDVSAVVLADPISVDPVALPALPPPSCSPWLWA